MSGPRSFACLLGIGLLGAVLGCGGSSSTSTWQGSPPGPTGGPVAAAGPADGKTVFEQNCQKCHALGGAAGKGKAPDLGQIGANRDAAWIAEHTKNPKTHKAGSKMPAFEGKLTAEQIKAVGEYLAAKK